MASSEKKRSSLGSLRVQVSMLSTAPSAKISLSPNSLSTPNIKQTTSKGVRA